MDKALKRAVDLLGGGARLAKAIGVTPQAVSQWERAPAGRCGAIEEATRGQVTREQLRPDFFAKRRAS